MPGIVGVIRGGGATPGVGASLDLLCHLPGYRRRETSPEDGLAIGQVWRPGDDGSRDWHAENGVSAFVTGAVFRPGAAPARIGAREIAADYAAHGEITPDRYDGSFVVVLHDAGRKTIRVWGDRLGGLPVHYAATGEGIAFAPEAKALFPALGLSPAFDANGVLSFLACGYCMGERTLFRDVRRLEPGTVLTIATGTRAFSTSRYFKMVYRPERAFRRRIAAEDAIHAALVEAHRMMMCDDDGRAEVLLSGGVDSRSILAVLDGIGARPRAAVSWGIRDDIPKSDGAVAADIARSYGVPFRFIRYDTDAFTDVARDWCRISELANDNIGWYAEGAPLLVSDYSSGAAFMATGDECFGVGGWVRSVEEMREDVLPAQLPATLAEIIAPRRRQECASIYDGEIDAVLAPCDNDDLIDRKDFLYVHARLARMVYSLGYYKELAVELRRPLTASCVLDVMQRIPARYRVLKNGFVSMLERVYPAVLRYPKATVDSLPDWEYDVRAKPALKALLLEALADDRLSMPVVGDLLDRDAARALRDRYFGERARPMRREPLEDRSFLSRRVSDRVKRGSRAFDLLRRQMGRNTRKRQRSAFHTLMALAQLSLLEQEMQKWRSPGPTVGTGENSEVAG